MTPQQQSNAPVAQWPELTRELTNSPEGFAANFQHLRNDVDRWLGRNTKDPAKFVQYFDELSGPVQDKILSVFRRNPSVSIDRLSAKVRAKLTLDESHEVSEWLRK
jgi:hypothetical protein